MSKLLVLYYSSYGHIEQMAQAQAEGAARIPNTSIVVKRVPETVPLELATTSGFKLDQRAPIASPDELEQYDAILFGRPLASAIWPRRCATSWTRLVFCGCATRSLASSPAYSAAPQASMVVRRQPSRRSIARFCTTE